LTISHKTPEQYYSKIGVLKFKLQRFSLWPP
jgi:hypothetical protein